IGVLAFVTVENRFAAIPLAILSVLAVHFLLTRQGKPRWALALALIAAMLGAGFSENQRRAAFEFPETGLQYECVGKRANNNMPHGAGVNLAGNAATAGTIIRANFGSGTVIRSCTSEVESGGELLRPGQHQQRHCFKRDYARLECRHHRDHDGYWWPRLGRAQQQLPRSAGPQRE